MTDVIILAAGVGSRLRPITNSIPKCMVSVNDVPLIERLLKQLNSIGSEIKIHIVLGYRAEVVIDRFKNFNINFIINDDYETTNNMYSFYLATQKINNISDMMIINADCIYDYEIVKKSLNSECSSIAVDYNFFSDESMKVEVIDGFVRGIAKDYKNDSNVFTSIDMYKFVGSESTEMISRVAQIVKTGELNSWTEVAINDIVKKSSVKFMPLPIDNLKWYEIDNHADLDIACKLFSNEGNV